MPEDKCKEIAAWPSATVCPSLSLLLVLDFLLEAIGKKHLERGDSREFVRDIVVGALKASCFECVFFMQFAMSLMECVFIFFAVDVEPELSSLWRSSFVKDCYIHTKTFVIMSKFTRKEHNNEP